jgi:hypothetical protein
MRVRFVAPFKKVPMICPAPHQRISTHKSLEALTHSPQQSDECDDSKSQADGGCARAVECDPSGFEAAER